MHRSSLLGALALVAPSFGLIRFQCSQLVIERLDPLVEPGQNPSAHLHQIIGGNSFNVTMSPTHDFVGTSTCTTCQFTEDLSNYWTAVLFFRARNGTYKRVPQLPNLGFEGAEGGITVYYMQNALFDLQQKSKVTAFRPGFRMITGEPTFRTKAQANKFRQLTFTCLETMSTRAPELMHLPTRPCATGIMANIRFPTCWDGKNLDSPNHRDHVSYPAKGTFEAEGPCPDSHPVKIPQLMYETIWNTRQFNNPEDWPEDKTKQPFYFSNFDNTGYGTHGDYMFGWKDDSLQKVMENPCYVNCPTLATQNIAGMNACKQKSVVDESFDGWLDQLPGVPESHRMAMASAEAEAAASEN